MCHHCCYFCWLAFGQAQRQADAAFFETRAWVIAQPAGDDAHVAQDKDGFITATISISDVGLTPAFRVRHRIIMGSYPYPLPDNISLPMPTEADMSGVKVSKILAPKIPFFDHVKTGVRYTEDAFAQVAKPTTKRFYFFGRIDYYDTFNK